MTKRYNKKSCSLLTEVWPALTVLVSVEVSELLRSHAGALGLPLPAGGARGAQGLPLDAEQRQSGQDHVAAGEDWRSLAFKI